MDSILLSAILSGVVVIFAAMFLGWAAEATEKFIAPGLALAILAFLQTLPEYTVEAVIAWSKNTHLMIANLTGSLRLLIGFGWPMIFFIAVISQLIKKKQFIKELELQPHQSLETIFLIPPVLYFIYIWFKGTMTPVDGIILMAMFIWFIKAISKAHVAEEETLEDSEMPCIPRKIVAAPRKKRNFYIAGLFIVGGIAIFAIAHPFVESLKSLAVSWGIGQFLFIQWVAPFVSEFPEKVTAFMWAARVKKATTGMMNMISSNLNQWMLLAGSLPIIFSISSGKYSIIEFDSFQREEILLTILQTVMVVVCMWNSKITWWKVFLIFGLWIFGFFFPTQRYNIIFMHLIAIALIVVVSFILQPIPTLWKKAMSARRV